MIKNGSKGRPRENVLGDEAKAMVKSQAEEIIKYLKKRNMDGSYFEKIGQAVASIIKEIPDGVLVGLGGSESIIESGLVNELRKKDIRLLDRYKNGLSKDEVWAMRREGLSADIYISSSNAITMDGKIVNMDGIGNRVAAMVFGPSKVILLVGMNKTVKTVEDAVARIKNYAAPRNAVRVKADTPCSKTGCCREEDCTPPNRICSQLVILESSMLPDRIKVFLVGEKLGF
jgi:predicted transcriptional regulator with HTH domain